MSISACGNKADADWEGVLKQRKSFCHKTHTVYVLPTLCASMESLQCLGNVLNVAFFYLKKYIIVTKCGTSEGFLWKKKY